MLKNILDIKNILYINLDHREDRKEHVEKQLNSIGLSGERFNAIKDNNPCIGCSLSHLSCLKLAKERNWDYVAICEDDITFTNPDLFIKQLNTFLSEFGGEWDVLLLGGNNVNGHTKITDYCIKVTNCQSAIGYIVKKHYYDKLIDNLEEGIEKLREKPRLKRYYMNDQYWKLLQKVDKWYLIIPLTVNQKIDYSDIEKRKVNYTRCMLKL